MKRMSTDELRELEVVNVCTGEKLGYPTDFEFDLEDCKICALIICVSEGFWGIFKQEKLVIPWCKIECIGEDTILVRLNSGECQSCEPKRPRKRR